MSDSTSYRHGDIAPGKGFKNLVGKIGQPLLFVILFLLTFVAAFLAANDAAFITFGIGGALLCLLVAYNCFFFPIRGYYLTLLVAFFAFFPQRIIQKDLPISAFVEVLVFLLFIGTIWKSKGDPNSKGNLLKSGITIMIIINVLYFIVEFFNPNNTPTGWIFGSKRYMVYILFFVITYKLINTAERFRFFMKFWLLMSFIAAAYACWQQWVGLFPFELQDLKKDPLEYALLFQGGVIRKFSFLDGVVTLGILSGSMAVISLVLAITEKNKQKKYQLIFAALIMFLSMNYTGTRTTTIMLPAGIALFILFTLKNKATLLTLVVSILTGLFLFLAPINNPTLNRMRSTFNSDDASLNVRTVNRASIQPYIHSHPIGGGISASGVEGMRFNPSHPLAGFPPDSGLLKLALDQGWIGLALNILWYLIIFYQGIYYYFKMKNNDYKRFILAILCGLFTIIITMYSQVSIGQIPNAFFFYGVLALLKRLMEFDEKESEMSLSKAEIGYI